jgi:CO dehydrogenase/acetyl-CoA synthase gamma subunit (corrinoid Fe-S protein)
MTDAAFKPLTQGSNDPTLFLTNSAATYYTVPEQPDNTVTMVRGITLCNTTGSAVAVRVHNVQSGDSAAAANAVFYDLSIAANTSVVVCYDEGAWVLTKGMTIQALAGSNSAVTITLCGEERA